MTVSAGKLRAWLDVLARINLRFPRDEDERRVMHDLERVADEMRVAWTEAIVAEAEAS